MQAYRCHDHGHVFLFFIPSPSLALHPPSFHPYATFPSLLSLLPSVPDGYTLLGLKAVTLPHSAYYLPSSTYS